MRGLRPVAGRHVGAAVVAGLALPVYHKCLLNNRQNLLLPDRTTLRYDIPRSVPIVGNRSPWVPNGILKFRSGRLSATDSRRRL